ncbi:Sorting nexin mvp1, partial [Coemansia sp. RSA 1287]
MSRYADTFASLLFVFTKLPSNCNDTTPAVSVDNVALPVVYAVAFSAAQKAGGGRVTRDALQQTLEFSGLPRHVTGQIVLTADTGADSLAQRDFNLALAMVALAQKNMSPTLESVMFHKEDLPVPELDGVETLISSSSNMHSSMPPGRGRLDAPDDPWSSASAGPGAVASSTAALGSMSLATNGTETASLPANADSTKKEHQQRTAGRDSSASQTFVPGINMDELQWKLDKEDVSIKESAERGGIVFKHTNYEISTRSFSSMVVRRYRDFDWISNYLVTRYPYRMHANIPPKGFPGKLMQLYFANKECGLTRFASAILRIPFLRRDALVIQFFTNTDEFGHVLKVGNLDMEAEDIDVEDELGSTPWPEVQQTYAAFDDFYAQVARDEERYRTQITSLEKIARYKQAIGDELNVYSDTMRLINAPRESVSGSRKFHVQAASKRTLDSNLNELSMSFSDASLLEKAHGE